MPSTVHAQTAEEEKKESRGKRREIEVGGGVDRD